MTDAFQDWAKLFRYTALYEGGSLAGMYDSMANVSDGLANSVRPEDSEAYACRPVLNSDDVVAMALPTSLPLMGMAKGLPTMFARTVTAGERVIVPYAGLMADLGKVLRGSKGVPLGDQVLGRLSVRVVMGDNVIIAIVKPNPGVRVVAADVPEIMGQLSEAVAVVSPTAKQVVLYIDDPSKAGQLIRQIFNVADKTVEE